MSKQSGPEHLAEIQELTIGAVHTWIAGGDDWETALDRLSWILDAALPLGALIGGPLGAIAEENDGKAIRAALGALDRALSPDPDLLRARAANAAANGRHRIAARRRKRAARIEARTQTDPAGGIVGSFLTSD